KCINAEEFPPFPKFESDGIQIEAKILLEMIRQTAFSASKDLARPVLTGVLVTIADEDITLASADGFRLSEHKARLSEPVAEPVSAIVPAKSLNELAHILKNKDEVVTIAFANGRVVFRTPDAELATQLIEGEFPDYRQIIPEDHTTRMVVPTDTLRKACQQAGVFARNDSLVATLDISEDTVEVSAQADELGSNRTQVAVVTEGTGMQIAFNTHYLQDALDIIQTPSVALELSDPVKPGTIRPVGEEQAFLHLLMPMNTTQ
ncbi:MAG: DNA polymerase III subunit beta, partial [Chloroflexi bacterium]|nr:DNA polymerase III subunit beta [Chloroflexota bacterium]